MIPPTLASLPMRELVRLVKIARATGSEAAFQSLKLVAFDRILAVL